MQTLKLDLRLKFFKMLGLSAMLAFLQGCATQFVAVGDWGQPSDLHLNEESLAGVKIGVRCMKMQKNGEIASQNYPLCKGLERHLAALGAKIVGKDEPGADLTLWYVEQGVVDKLISGGSVVGLIFTAGIVPMVSTATSRAELRVSDAKGVILERETLEASKVRVFGWSAWIGLGHRSRERDFGKKFYNYAKNRLVSQAINLKLAQSAKEEP